MSAPRPGRGGHQPRKRFGQNFLRDQQIIDAIAASIDPSSEDHLVEIGPGEGALTAALITSGCRYDAIELDRDLTTVLLASFSIYDTFSLHSADALKFDFQSLPGTRHTSGQNDTDAVNGKDTAAPGCGKKLRVVGNLPYNISTPLIFKLLEHAAIIEDMHFMLQLEVVQRLAAVPGSKHWGRLGVMTQFYCDVVHLIDVPPESFYPPPKVQSAVVRLRPHARHRWPDCDPATLKQVTQLAFSQRRKTLRNNFKGLLGDGQLEAIGIDPGQRAESLMLKDFVSLAGLM